MLGPRSAWWLSSAFVIGAFLGCGSKPLNLPATYPVRGTVVAADGKPLTGGAIRLTSNDKDRYEATGEIGADGKFELRTIAQGERLTGAVAGPHRAVVLPDGKPGDILPAIELKEVTVEAKENDLKITLPK